MHNDRFYVLPEKFISSNLLPKKLLELFHVPSSVSFKFYSECCSNFFIDKKKKKRKRKKKEEEEEEKERACNHVTKKDLRKNNESC